MDGTFEAEPLTAKVPVLKHEGRTMVESLLVAAYVARAFESQIDYASAAEKAAGALFASQFNALTPLYMQALKAKSQPELDDKIDALRAQLRQCERALAVAQAHCADARAAHARGSLRVRRAVHAGGGDDEHDDPAAGAGAGPLAARRCRC